MAEPSPLPPFEPPYDSPIEQMFAWGLSKHLRPDVELRKQVDFTTFCGRFVVDLLAVLPDEFLIAFECDGRAYHDWDRDEWRDAVLLGDGHLDTIIRATGADIHYRLDDVLYVVAHHYPELFTDRGREIIERLASDRIKRSEEIEHTTVEIEYPEHARSPDHEPPVLLLHHRTRRLPPGRRPFWVTLYLFAHATGGGPLDDVIRRYKEQGGQDLSG